jgi:uncharacterized protein (DUF1800 family)
MDTRTAHALVRFGLGTSPAPPPSDPERWLARQLDGPDAALAVTLPDSAEGLAAVQQQRRDKGDGPSKDHIRDIFRTSSKAAFDTLATTETPFRERLVWFWANHFTVSLRRGVVTPVFHAYIREAIRPYVTSGFADMLLAVMRHPAMLLYLDNAQSIGPNSRAGRMGNRGLNENLARECMELHTVTPASGYTQDDVTAFARILTGWSLDLTRSQPGYTFRPAAHEPGEQTVMGRSFPNGEIGGEQALAFLANHKATHHHLATKLVRHFVADTPPPAAVARIEAVLRDTKGDLKATSLALTRLPEAWATPLAKLRSPADYVIAVTRALDLPADKRPDMQAIMASLGQPFFSAPLPNGWPDTADEWAGSEAMLRRIDWAYAVAGRAPQIDPAALAQATLGPLLPPATLQQIARAGDRREALTLLLAAPEFQRR